MPDDLVFDSPAGRELFLVALREFSESCVAPELIAECPFSTVSEPGVRSCGEECMDLLGLNHAPDPIAAVTLDDGLTIRRRVRPRARREPGGPSKPYDAKEIYQEDSGASEPRRWRLAALIYGLGELIKTAPPVDSSAAQTRLNRIAEVIDLIESRGIDVEKHLDHWLRQRVNEGLMSALRRPVLRQELPEFAHGTEWVDLLVGAGDKPIARAEDVYHTVLQTVITWSQRASRKDLLDWKPPEHLADGFPSLAEYDAGAELGQWLVDRFCTTYISEWKEASLRQEWQYMHGSLMPPCPATEMSIRPVAEDDLGRVMAHRMANSEFAHRTHSIAPSLVEPAVAFLEEGRRTEAAALFEALLRMDPSDATTQNNLGFCMLPDQPARAAELFEQATELDPDLDLASMNRVLALALLGKRDEAIDSARQLHEEVGSRLAEENGWLWDVDSVLSENEPFITFVQNCGSYLEELVHILEGGQEPAS